MDLLDKKSKPGHETIVFLFLLLGVPLVINLLLTYGLPNIPFLKSLFLTGENLNNATWLDFWGSYLGALIGVVPAYLALTESRKQAKQQQRESLEARRCSLMPIVDLTLFHLQSFPSSEERSKYFGYIRERDSYISVIPEEFTEEAYHEKPYCYYDFYVRNIGPGPSLGATITLTTPGKQDMVFYGDVSTTLDVHQILEIQPPVITPTRTLDFCIRYQDVFENVYERTLKVIVDFEGIVEDEFSPPKLIKRSAYFDL